MVGNILVFCQLFIVLYSFYINFKNSTKAILTLVMFLILIGEFNTIKILRNNDTEIVAEKI